MACQQQFVTKPTSGSIIETPARLRSSITVMRHQAKVVVTNWVHSEVLDLLSSQFNVDANRAREPWTRDGLIGRASDADALLTFMTDSVDEAFLDRCPRLRIIACALKGADNFDVEACTRRRIAVTIVPDLLTAPTAELAIGLMIGLARNIVQGDRLVRSGEFTGWRPALYGRGLDGSTVGILGMGAVGRAIAHRLRAFRCSLMYSDDRPLEPSEEDGLGLIRADFDALLRRSDYLVLALPLTPGTLHLIGREALARMKPGALLVNPARGSIVDEDAVADALQDGHLGGYAADVFEMEDWARTDRPRSITRRLLAHPATVLTPHIGSAVDAVRRDIAMSAARDIVDYLSGRKPAGLINPSTMLRMSA
jgi:phosphonate dehydrogenase